MSDDDLARLLDDFARAHEAGEHPDPADYLARAGAERETFGDLLEAYLLDVPAPPDPERIAALAADPRFAPPTWASLLREGRERRGLLRSRVAAAVTERLGLQTTAQPRVELRLHELEAGSLAPARVTERVVDAIAAVLVDVADALRATRLLPPPPLAASSPLMRASLAQLPAPAPATYVSAPPDDPDAREVDRLFGIEP